MKTSNMKSTLFGVTLLVYCFLWTPAGLLIFYSFSKNRFGMKWEGFTLKWYLHLLNSPRINEAILKSLIIASVTMVLATIAGTVTAYGLYKYKFRGKKLLRTSILLPIVIPYVVTGASLLVFFTRVMHIPLGYPSIIIAHITFSTPLAVFVIMGRMQRMDWAWEEASMDLGANRLTTWRKITIPFLLPAVISSAVLIFPWSFNDFTITYFVAGLGTTTLPIYIFSQLQYSLEPVIINVTSTIFVALPVIGLFIMNVLQKERT